MISIIIPALNEELRIAGLIRDLEALPGAKEIIVADGQSEDRTAAAAAAAGAIVIQCSRGRGIQLHEGAMVASGDVLWFVHADSIPSPESIGAVDHALQDPRTVAGNFTLIFEGQSLAARSMTWIYPKLKLLGLSYGDAGIFVRRTAYDAIDGFRPLPLFEDLDFVRRLKPLGRFVTLKCHLFTSSRRFEGKRNYLGAWVKWIALQLLYWAGVSPDWLANWYRPIR